MMKWFVFFIKAQINNFFHLNFIVLLLLLANWYYLATMTQEIIISMVYKQTFTRVFEDPIWPQHPPPPPPKSYALGLTLLLRQVYTVQLAPSW